MHVRRLITIIITLALTGCSLFPSKPAADDETAVQPAGVDIEQIGTASLPAKLPVPHAAAPQPQEQEASGPQYDDAWQRIRHNLTLSRHTNRFSVKTRINWYKRHQEYLDRVSERATPYLYYIIQQLDKRDMPLELALLPVVESAYQPFAYSPSRASGLWQFIPGTGRLYGLKQNWWYDGRRDVVAATNAALDYLQKLHDEFNDSWLLALAAYNSGELSVARAIRRNRRAGKNTDFWSLHLPRETRGYVPSLLAIAEIVAHPKRYDIKLEPVPNQPYFAKVDVGGQLDLAVAADMTGLSMDELYTLNPGFNRWATDPDGPHYLLVPADKKDDFKQQLAQLPEDQRVNWKRHVIQRGESLSEIAEHYHTSVATIRDVNNLRGSFIRTGHSLLIPSSKEPLKHYSLSLDNRRYRGLKRIGSGEKYLYAVRSGDTLWDIGRQYGVSISQLCAWNGISPRHYLRPGQKLTLWLAENDSGKDADDGGDAADAADTSQADSGATKYTVRSGDSLWLIARRFGVSVDDLVAWNDISPRHYLRPGQELVLQQADADSGDNDGAAGNSDSGADNDGAGDNDSADVAQSGQKQQVGGMTYTVHNGDSLWLIARRFGVTVDDLLAWNNISPGHILQPGQEITLQLAGGSDGDSGAVVGVSNQDNTAGVINYTVQRGDSLWLISRRFGVTVAQLLKWNNLSRSSYLQPGQELILLNAPALSTGA